MLQAYLFGIGAFIRIGQETPEPPPPMHLKKNNLFKSSFIRFCCNCNQGHQKKCLHSNDFCIR